MRLYNFYIYISALGKNRYVICFHLQYILRIFVAELLLLLLKKTNKFIDILFVKYYNHFIGSRGGTHNKKQHAYIIYSKGDDTHRKKHFGCR